MQLPAKGMFVTGTDTEVGKTYFSCCWIEEMVRSGVRVGAYKPLASGVSRIEDSDGYRLWNAIGRIEPVKRVNPQSYSTPLAPPLAAEAEGVEIEEELIWRGAEYWAERCDYFVIEGAGGLLSPVTWTLTNADLAQTFGYPITIVAANRLGVVHQVLSCVTAARSRGLRVAKVVLNELVETTSDLAATSNERLLRPFLKRISSEIEIERLRAGSAIIDRRS